MPTDDFTSLESKLRRSLMPAAMSDSATESIHTMLDELAGQEYTSPIGGQRRDEHGRDDGPKAAGRLPAPRGAGILPAAKNWEVSQKAFVANGAAINPETHPAPAPWRAAAAAVAGLLAVSAWFASPSVEKLAFSALESDTRPHPGSAQTMHLVDESTRLAWVEDEGWLDDPDGGALRAVRMRVVEENRLLDQETGIIVHVASPREEMLFMPVSTF